MLFAFDPPVLAEEFLLGVPFVFAFCSEVLVFFEEGELDRFELFVGLNPAVRRPNRLIFNFPNLLSHLRQTLSPLAKNLLLDIDLRFHSV